MLILTRKAKERILFPTMQTSITVSAIRSSVVCLGIDAPPNIPVLREELLHRQLSPRSKSEQVGKNLDKHLLRHQFDLLLHIFQTLVRQPLLRSHPVLEKTLSHFLDQMRALEQQMHDVAADAPLSWMGALAPVADAFSPKK
jgi:carbon storage regulator CsrA